MKHFRILILCTAALSLSFVRGAAAADNVRQIKISGTIDSPTVAQVIDAMSGKVTELQVEIDSPGGMVGSTKGIIEVFKFLGEHKVKIRCLVTGNASSAAFVILESCTERLATSKATMMMHEPFLVHIPDGDDKPSFMSIKAIRTMLAELEDDSKYFADVITPKMLLTPKQYHDRLDAGGMEGWRMTAPEALTNHAIDAIKETF